MKYNQSLIKSKEKIAKIFKDKKSKKNENERIPPGQYQTEKFPVLDLGIKPNFDSKTYKLKVSGLIEKEIEFTYDQILKMPSIELTEDFHCVTHWSKLDVKWKGVSFKEFLKIIKVKPNWKYLIQYGMDGYSTNVPREDLEKENVILAYELDGQPIPQEHGWPLRIIIPHLYGWKSSKFLNALKFVEKDEPGFWETRGYNNHGDIWKEERYG
ncbi:MAG TPA: sulfite oxidase-like oxidoreductase [Candidatus Nanoarchaeia archaeon]|nr:sulfite oxidase-like oxidoreductase [Candidatus Nanoarchaeia archaeon]